MMERQAEIFWRRFGEIVEVIIPPPKTAVASPRSVLVPSVRDRHIAEIRTKGQMAGISPPEGCDRSPNSKRDILPIRRL
jgi:hypothetical protein